jgi:hypothetical protein
MVARESIHPAIVARFTKFVIAIGHNSIAFFGVFQANRTRIGTNCIKFGLFYGNRFF